MDVVGEGMTLVKKGRFDDLLNFLGLVSTNLFI